MCIPENMFVEFHADREYINVCQISCPACGGKKYIFSWRPGKCIHCGTDMRGYGDGDYQAKDETRMVELNPLTGDLMAVEESV